QVMLDADAQPGGLLEQPAADLAAAVLAAGQSRTLIGQKLGDYQVISIVAAGGMGEVYLATDTRLGRKVTLKLLPEEFTADPERLRRFEQEARAVSALYHPNIVTIYGVG